MDSHSLKELKTICIKGYRAEVGDKGLTAIISDHCNPQIVNKHYMAQTEAVKKSSDLRIFTISERCVRYAFQRFSLPHKIKGIKKVSVKH